MLGVENLLDRRRAFGGSLAITRSSITRDHFDSRMPVQPLSQDFLVTTQQDINRAMLLQVHQNGTGGGFLLKSPVVHTKHPRGWEFINPCATKLRKESRSTDRHRLLSAQTATSFSSQCPSAVPQPITEAARSTGMCLR